MTAGDAKDTNCEEELSETFSSFSVSRRNSSLEQATETESIQENISSLVHSITQELVRSSPLACSGSECIPSNSHSVYACRPVMDEIQDSPPLLPLILAPRVSSSPSPSPLSALVASSAGDDTLPQVLHALDKEDDKRIVVVRRITKLGFKSARIIKSKFQEYGWVVKTVVLLPSRSRLDVKDNSLSSQGAHSRPSSMGFVVLGSESDAIECVAVGSLDIEGVNVVIQPFSRQYRPTRNE